MPKCCRRASACEEGWRGRPTPDVARRWYLRAARRGCFNGCFATARFAMADGDVDGAVLWLRQAIAAGSKRFCIELGDYLSPHPDQRLREVAAAAYARGSTAPEVPPAQTMPPARAQPLAPGRSKSRVKRMLAVFSGTRKPARS